tara:strand:- start:196 stop:411 length:216 start_codon:yes stop_codon:yes gene_type:complete
MINKKKVKDIFHKDGLQINTEAINILDDEVKRLLRLWSSNCVKGNIKRLTPNLMWVAYGISIRDRNERSNN